MTSAMLCSLKTKTSTETMIIPSTKRVKLDVESGVESLAGIFQDSPGSITQDPPDGIDSIVRDVIDYTVHNNCNGTSNAPRNVRDKYHQQNALDDQSYSAVQSVGDSGNCSNCCAKRPTNTAAEKRS